MNSFYKPQAGEISGKTANYRKSSDVKIPGLLLVEGSEERRSNNYTGVLKEIE